MNKNFEIKVIENDKELNDAKSVRKRVFQEEQGIDQKLDFDGKDFEADHLIVYAEGNPIGTVRVRYLPEKNKKIAKIERLAVLNEYRGKGLGKKIVNFLHDFLKNKGIEEIKLDSQEHAKEFYEKIGYKQKGETFEEVGIPHVEMRKYLK